MEARRYLLALTAALAAGYGLGEMDLLEAQAKPIEHTAVVNMDLGPGAGSTLDGFLVAQFCPKVEEVFALTPGRCDTALLDSQESSYTLYKRDSDADGVLDKWSLNRGMSRSGSFVPD